MGPPGGPDPLKNHKATKPAFNVMPSLAHQGNDVSSSAAGGIWILSPHQIKKKILKKMSELDRTPSEKTFWIWAWTLSSCNWAYMKILDK